MKNAKALLKPSPILIRRARKRTDYSQDDIAEMLATSQSLVSRWESGKSTPTQKTLLKLAQVLGCDYDDFFPVDIPALKSAYSKVLEDYLTDPEADTDKKAKIAVEIMRIIGAPEPDNPPDSKASDEMNQRIHALMFGTDDEGEENDKPD